MSLGPNGVNRVSSLRKIMTQFCGTNFCTNSSRFALSFVRQPNGPKCIQIVQNTPKYVFRVQWGGSGAFLRKIPAQLRGMNFCTSSARFVLSFVTQPNCHKCTQIVRNTRKHTRNFFMETMQKSCHFLFLIFSYSRSHQEQLHLPEITINKF